MLKIMIVPKARKQECKELLEEYLTELSQFDPDIKFDDKGIPIYKWFDNYWTDCGRYPFYFFIEGSLAGFVLMRDLDEGRYEVAEFYVKPNFRGNGNAMWLAGAVLDMFEGSYDISTRHTNPRAIRFWDKFTSNYKKLSITDDDIWRTWIIKK